MIDYSWFREIVYAADLGMVNQIIMVAIIAVSCIAITRNTNQIKKLLFPMTVGYSMLGMDINPIVTVAFTIVWASTLMNLNALGGMLQSFSSVVHELHPERIAQRARDIKTRYMSDRELLSKYGTFDQDLALREQERGLGFTLRTDKIKDFAKTYGLSRKEAKEQLFERQVKLTKRREDFLMKQKIKEEQRKTQRLSRERKAQTKWEMEQRATEMARRKTGQMFKKSEAMPTSIEYAPRRSLTSDQMRKEMAELFKVGKKPFRMTPIKDTAADRRRLHKAIQKAESVYRQKTGISKLWPRKRFYTTPAEESRIRRLIADAESIYSGDIDRRELYQSEEPWYRRKRKKR